jgi:DNA-binding transcriptional ArsR family regulator
VEPLKVVAAPHRLRILQLVWDREMTAGDIAAEFDVSWPAISQHLRVLKSAGFVLERREGVSRIYRADQAALGPLRAVVEAQWQAGFVRLRDVAEAEHRDKKGER